MICEHSAGGSKSTEKKPVGSGRVSVLGAPVSAAFSLRVRVGRRALRQPWPLLCRSQVLSVPRVGPGSSWVSGRARVGGPLLAHTQGHASSGSHFLREAARVLGFLLFSPVFLRAAAQWIVDGVSARLALPSAIPVGVCPPGTLPAFPLWYVPRTCTPVTLNLALVLMPTWLLGILPLCPNCFQAPFLRVCSPSSTARGRCFLTRPPNPQLEILPRGPPCPQSSLHQGASFPA